MELTREALLGEAARRFEPAGFAVFFTLVTGLILPKHHQETMREAFEVFANDDWVGIVIEMFRGSAKTTVWNNAFGAWLVGQFPEYSGLIVQSGDDIANDNSSKIAAYVEHNDGFRLVFPHVVPDKEAGWGAKGYNVKMTHVDASLGEELPYSQWQRMRKTKDPTFVGVGYSSSAIIGKRPHWLIIDDIHDEKNTRSELRQREVKDVVKGTIGRAANHAVIRVIIGTPWNDSDVIAYYKSISTYKQVKVPVYTKGKPTWPEWMPEKKIQQEREESGEIEFARMYELDLEKTKGLVLKREWLEPHFPAQEIRKDWPAIAFIDYTSTADPLKERSDYFALAIGQIVPGNRKIVISDGIYRRVTHLDAQRLAVAKILEYPTLLVVGVEAVFAGNEYGHALEQNQELIDNGVFPELCRGGPWQRRKGERFEKFLADAFRKGTLVLSDGENELLNAVPDEWVNWQGDALAGQYHDDALDAVFGVWHLGKEWIVHGLKNREYKPTNPMYEREGTDFAPISGFFRSRNG